MLSSLSNCSILLEKNINYNNNDDDNNDDYNDDGIKLIWEASEMPNKWFDAAYIL